MSQAKRHFETPMVAYVLDTFLAINNAAAVLLVALFYRALGEPMGYDDSEEPTAINFIVPSRQEQLLLELRAVFEQLTKHQKIPILFQ